MTSIPQNSSVTQSPVTQFRHVFINSPDQIRSMSREQLQQLALEQSFLLTLIIQIVRNPLAAIATRVIAIDLIIYFVEKSLHRQVETITERSRIYISGTGGIAARLGIHANTVSSSLRRLYEHGMIARDYFYDQEREREYLEATLQPALLTTPQRLQDKTLRKVASAGKKKAPATASVEIEQGDQGATTTTTIALVCPSCGSKDGHIAFTCHSCGTVSSLQEMQSAQSQGATSDEDESPTPPDEHVHNNCVVINNAPQDSEVLLPDQPHADETDLGEQPPLSDIAQETSPVIARSTADQAIEEWLSRRIGHGRLIYATGRQETQNKYMPLPEGAAPDYARVIAGQRNHVLGSYLLREDSTTWVLCFDLDTPDQYAQYPTFLRAFAAAGAIPVFWQRRGQRGHLEIYFSNPVDPTAAYLWALSVCPGIETADEVFPVQKEIASRQERADYTALYPTTSRHNHPLSWPLYVRSGNEVTACVAHVMFPGRPPIYTVSMSQKPRLASMVQRAITPASIVETFTPPENIQRRPGRLPNHEQLILAPAEATQARPASQNEIIRIVIAQFNEATTWEELIERCGGSNTDGKFCAVWRGEDTPSVRVDRRDENYAADYGRLGAGDPFKLDKFELWCRLEAMQAGESFQQFKKRELARRCSEYRDHQGATNPLPAQVETTPPSAAPVETSTPAQGDPTAIDTVLAAIAHRAGRYEPQEPCTKCGCTFTYDLAGSRACCRCLPVKGMGEEIHAIMRTLFVKGIVFGDQPETNHRGRTKK
jgi:hypothetical protein